MQSDFDDIRFVDDKGNILPYWIENKVDSNYAEVWVKVPEIPANSNKTIWLYYGNPSVTSASNGDKVFEFFDDFENMNKWEIIRGTSSEAYVSDGHLVLDGLGPTTEGITVRTKSQLNLPNKLRIEGKVIADDWNEWVGFMLSPTNDINLTNYHGFDDGYDFGWWGWSGENHSMRTWQDGEQNNDHGIYSGFFNASTGIYYLIGGAYDGSTLYHYKPTTDGSIIVDHERNDTVYQNQNWLRIFCMVWDDAKWEYNFIRVRKYTSIEPNLFIESEQPASGKLMSILRKDNAYALSIVEDKLNGLINGENVSYNISSLSN